jgi:hypothetical protein
MAARTGLSSTYQQVPLSDEQHIRSDSGRSLPSGDKWKPEVVLGTVLPQPRKWSVGWKTPILVIGFYTTAIVIAAGNYLYCRRLDRRPVGETVKQAWNNSIVVAFVRVFSMALTGSASAAFAQLLWWFLRRKPLALERIDSAFSLISSPLSLLHVGLLRALPIIWFFGLLFPLISVAAIFPPGALVVQILWSQNSTMMRVPTLDVAYRGDNTPISFFDNAMFMTGPDGDYQYVTSAQLPSRDNNPCQNAVSSICFDWEANCLER